MTDVATNPVGMNAATEVVTEARHRPKMAA